MKATLSKIKKNLQGTNSEGEETRIRIIYLEQGRNTHSTTTARRKKIKRILKAAREKQRVTYKGVPVRL